MLHWGVSWSIRWHYNGSLHLTLFLLRLANCPDSPLRNKAANALSYLSFSFRKTPQRYIFFFELAIGFFISIYYADNHVCQQWLFWSIGPHWSRPVRTFCNRRVCNRFGYVGDPWNLRKADNHFEKIVVSGTIGGHHNQRDWRTRKGNGVKGDV
mgnify:CR=1 FL=1